MLRAHVTSLREVVASGLEQRARNNDLGLGGCLLGLLALAQLQRP